MKHAPRVAVLVLSCVHWVGVAARANSFEGEWLGGFRGKDDWVFLQVQLGGEGVHMAGRADLPALGLSSILLQDVAATGTCLSFELPGTPGGLQFKGELRPDGRITGAVRQGRTAANFELLRTTRLSQHALDALTGTFQVSGEDSVILVYRDGSRLSYVDYATGRTGRLFALDETRFVSGPSVLTGYPVELVATFDRDPRGRAVRLTWQRAGTRDRSALRRDLYHTEDVWIPSGGDVRLSGSLLVPNGRGPHSALVIVPGSGLATRGSLLPFADSFARHGIAVLINDKRGVGGSSGDPSRVGIDELADDALAGVAWLKTNHGIDHDRIGLVGASVGGWAAPLAATRSPDVKFVVVEAAPAVNPMEHETLRVRNQMLADRWPFDAVARAVGFLKRKVAVARSGEGWSTLEREAAVARREGWASYVNVPASLEDLRWNWQHVFSYDPRPTLRALKVPVLALYGGVDRVVDARTNKEELQRALRSGGNQDITVRVLPDANHNFLAARTGGRREAPRLAAFVAGYFDTRVQWVLAHVTDTRPSPGTPSIARRPAGTTGGDAADLPPERAGRQAARRGIRSTLRQP